MSADYDDIQSYIDGLEADAGPATSDPQEVEAAARRAAMTSRNGGGALPTVIPNAGGILGTVIRHPLTLPVGIGAATYYATGSKAWGAGLALAVLLFQGQKG